MRIEKTVDPSFGLNTYYLIENGHVILIDPIVPLKTWEHEAEFRIDFAILTHEHYDHIRCVNALRADRGIRFLCGEKAQKGLADPALNMSRYIEYLKRYIPFGTGTGESCEYVCRADEGLEDGRLINWQGHRLLIKETPGHSAGSIALVADGQAVFSGDTIFKDYPSATRMPGGSTKAFQTVTEPWLDSLPQDILVYPGHAEPFKLRARYRIQSHRIRNK